VNEASKLLNLNGYPNGRENKLPLQSGTEACGPGTVVHRG